MNKTVIVLAPLLAAFSMTATAQEMCIKGGYPAQVNGLTCQSRYFALALGHLAPTVFSIGSVNELTALETNIRNAITKLESNPDKVTHGIWKKAIENYTSNNFTLIETPVGSYDELVRKLAEMVGWSVNLDRPTPPSLPIQTKRLPGLSINRIAGQTYQGGHVVAVLSVDLLTHKLVVANSWQKDTNNKPLHEGHVVLTDDLVLKNFGSAQRPEYHIYEIASK